MSDPYLFLSALLVVLGAPGPTNALLAASGAIAGFRRSLPLLIAALGGYLTAILAIRLLLEPAITLAPAIRPALGLAGALYLAWAAVKLWRAPPDTRPAAIGPLGVFTTTLFNPKAFVFAFTIIPWDGAPTSRYLAVFCISVLAVGCGWIALGQIAARPLSAVASRVAAATLGGFALVLVAGLLR